MWSPLFSCSPALLLVSPRLSREIQGLLAVAGRRLVVAQATGRPRSLTYPHRTGRSTSGSVSWVLSTGGRLEVGQSSGVRTFKQEMWRVCVVLWRCAASDHCERRPTILPSQSRRKMERRISEKFVGIEICSAQLMSHRMHQPCENTPAHLPVTGRSFGRTLQCSRSSDVSEVLVVGVTMALNHGENAFIPAAPPSWLVWAKQHFDNSTARLQNPWGQCEKVLLVTRLLHSMSRDKRTGSTDHFGHFACVRGSDGNSRRIRRQLVRWRTVQAYTWHTSQFVNILELASLLNFLRPLPARGEIISRLHVPRRSSSCFSF